MLKRLTLLLVLVLTFFFASQKAISANDENIIIDFFYGNTCPHCAAEKAFLDELTQRYDNVVINVYEVYDDLANRELLKDKAELLGIEVNGVPFVVINDKDYFVGYNQGYTDQKIEDVIKGLSNDDVMIDLPFIGMIDARVLSLPILTIILGVVDGFNPCAMWVLLFLISMLISVKDKKRLWILGLTFILASAIMYYIFMASWLNITMYLKVIDWLRLLVAFIALGGGSFNLYRSLKQKEAGCQVVDDNKRDKVLDRIKRFTNENRYIIAIIGMIGLAITINMIELLCSAGLPVIYAQILAMNDLSSFQYYLYLALYVLFFMLDDIIVFGFAIITMEITGISTKFARVSHIIGAVLMIIIGILLIVNPGLLMFN